MKIIALNIFSTYQNYRGQLGQNRLGKVFQISRSRGVRMGRQGLEERESCRIKRQGIQKDGGAGALTISNF